MSFALPVAELSLSEMRGFRLDAKNKAIREALRLALASDENGLVVRGILPHTDLGAPAGSGYTNEVFLTGAVVANTWTSVYDTANVAQLAGRKVLVIYKIVNTTAAPSITGVRFRLGATGTSTLAWFQVAPVINTQLTPELYMSEPVVYSKDQWADIQCISPVAIPAAGERLGFVGYVVEPVGETLS